MSQANLDIAMDFCRQSFQRSFGLSDERTEKYAKVVGELLDHASHATIERCAQVADEYNHLQCGKEIGRRIRALKDKT